MKKHWLIVVALIIPIGIIWKMQFTRTLREFKRAPSDSQLARTQMQFKRDLRLILKQLSDQITSLKNLANPSPPAPLILDTLARQIAGYATSTGTTTSPANPTTSR